MLVSPKKLKQAGVLGLNERNSDFIMRLNPRRLYPRVDDKLITKTLALEAAEHNVTVNAISPGATDTPLNQTAYTSSVRATYEERIPLGRIGGEDEIADVIVFLASTASRYITGQELVVDGGMTI